MTRQLQKDGLGDTKVRVNRTKANLEENMGGLLKSETSVRVAHGFNSNKNFGLRQEGLNFIFLLNYLSNQEKVTDQYPLGLGRWTSI